MKLYHLLSLILVIILIAYVIYLKVKNRNLGFKNLRLQMSLNSKRELLLECQNKLKDCESGYGSYTAGTDPYKKPTIPSPKKISQYNKNGDIIGNFTSLRDASRKTGITRYNIKKSCDNPKEKNTKSYFRYTK